MLPSGFQCNTLLPSGFIGIDALLIYTYAKIKMHLRIDQCTKAISAFVVSDQLLPVDLLIGRVALRVFDIKLKFSNRNKLPNSNKFPKLLENIEMCVTDSDSIGRNSAPLSTCLASLFRRFVPDTIISPQLYENRSIQTTFDHPSFPRSIIPFMPRPPDVAFDISTKLDFSSSQLIRRCIMKSYVEVDPA